MDRIDKFIDGLEEIFADLRERHVDDSVCGLCEYDGAYMGQSGDWCNECPGFDRDDCFKLSDKTRKEWTEEIIKALPTIQPELDSETLIRTIETGIAATNSNDAYSLGMRNGMRWCKSLIDGAEPKFEDDVMSVDDGKELPSAQPEPSIPLSWIEKFIEWLKSLDNEFANLAAADISIMVERWRGEQNEQH